jgi:hypothetical protein
MNDKHYPVSELKDVQSNTLLNEEAKYAFPSSKKYQFLAQKSIDLSISKSFKGLNEASNMKENG